MKLVTRELRGTPALAYAEGSAVEPSEGRLESTRAVANCPSGVPLLLLHGVTRCWREWEPLIPEFARQRHVLALDQRGHGGSGRASSYLVTDYVADAVRLVREVVGRPLVIHGHSLGAMVAAAVAAELPELVRGVTLEDPPFHTMGKKIAGSAWEAQFIGMREVARRGGTIEQLADALAEIRLPMANGTFKRMGELRDRAALLWSAECLTHLDPEVLTPIIEGRWLDGYDVAHVFARIRCPVLLMQADPSAGGTLTDEDAQLALSSIADCRKIRFTGASHQIHRDQLDAMLRTIREFAATL